MSEGICDFRFAICDLAGLSLDLPFAIDCLSVTPRLSGVCALRLSLNRFSGFSRAVETAEAVQLHHQGRLTCSSRVLIRAANMPPMLFGMPPEIANLKSYGP